MGLTGDDYLDAFPGINHGMTLPGCLLADDPGTGNAGNASA